MKIIRSVDEALHMNGAIIDLDLKEIDVKFSLSHALTGGGLLSDISAHGISGILDRRTTIWTEEMQAAYHKREASKSDFRFESVKVKDLAMTIYQEYPDRPLELQIFNMKLPRLRQHWLLFDILDADTAHGKFDNSLFSLENLEVDNQTQSRKVGTIPRQSSKELT
jgi:mitochondrial distribution and morphology protein 31